MIYSICVFAFMFSGIVVYRQLYMNKFRFMYNYNAIKVIKIASMLEWMFKYIYPVLATTAIINVMM